MLKYISNHLNEIPLSLLCRTVSSFCTSESTNFRKAIEVAKYPEPAYTVFLRFTLKEISGMAIVNDEGNMIGGISGRDFLQSYSKTTRKETFWEDLYKPVGLFVNSTIMYVMTNSSATHPTDTLKEVIHKLVKWKHHRLFVVNKYKPECVVSLCDVISIRSNADV